MKLLAITLSSSGKKIDKISETSKTKGAASVTFMYEEFPVSIIMLFYNDVY